MKSLEKKQGLSLLGSFREKISTKLYVSYFLEYANTTTLSIYTFYETKCNVTWTLKIGWITTKSSIRFYCTSWYTRHSASTATESQKNKEKYITTEQLTTWKICHLFFRHRYWVLDSWRVGAIYWRLCDIQIVWMVCLLYVCLPLHYTKGFVIGLSGYLLRP